ERRGGSGALASRCHIGIPASPCAFTPRWRPERRCMPAVQLGRATPSMQPADPARPTAEEAAMRFRVRGGVLAVVLALLAGSVDAVSIGQSDTFQDGLTLGWSS